MTSGHHKHRGIFLLGSPVLAVIADGLLTVVGQSDSHLAADVSSVREWNPIARYLLSQSIEAFAIGVLCWLIIVCVTITLLRDRHAIMFSLLICGAHLFGVSSWLIRYPYGILWVFLLWLGIRFTVFPHYQRGLRSAS